MSACSFRPVRPFCPYKGWEGPPCIRRNSNLIPVSRASVFSRKQKRHSYSYAPLPYSQHPLQSSVSSDSQTLPSLLPLPVSIVFASCSFSRFPFSFAVASPSVHSSLQPQSLFHELTPVHASCNLHTQTLSFPCKASFSLSFPHPPLPPSRLLSLSSTLCFTRPFLPSHGRLLLTSSFPPTLSTLLPGRYISLSSSYLLPILDGTVCLPLRVAICTVTSVFAW